MATDITPEQAIEFKSALREQVAIWSDLPIEYSSEPGSELAYDQMGRTLLTRINESGVDKRFESTGTAGGMSVVPRFMYAGARRAAIQGFDLEQLQRGMYNHDSFNTLVELTRENIHTAKRIEIPLGLKPLPLVSVDYHIDEFQLDEVTGLSVPRYKHIWQDARMDAYFQGHVDGERMASRWESQCPGYTTGILQMVYRSMLLICLEDKNLFHATLERETQPSDEAA